MFDIGWSELLIVVVVALILFGPNELMVVMRTLGRYVGILRRHADEFRGYFESAMQEAELDKMKAELNSVGEGVKQSVEDGVEKLNEDLSVQDVAERVVSGEAARSSEVHDEPLSVTPEKADAS